MRYKLAVVIASNLVNLYGTLSFSLIMSQLKLFTDVDFEVIQETVSEILGKEVKEVDFIGKSKNDIVQQYQYSIISLTSQKMNVAR